MGPWSHVGDSTALIPSRDVLPDDGHPAAEIDYMSSGLRNTGLEPVGAMPWATHFCQFYETRDDLLDALVPFFKTGLESNEFCAWVVSEPLTEDVAWQALERAVPGFDRYVSDHSIEVLNAGEVYLAGGKIDRHRIIDAWNKKLQTARSRGYQGIRVSGDTAWLEQTRWAEFMEYEAEVNRGVGDQPMLLLCTYPLTRSDANVFDVMGTHQFAVARRRGRWEIVETPQLTQAKAEIVRLNRELEPRVLERATQLESAIADQRQALSALQEAQKALAHVTRLTTIGEVTASLAHQVNQPLTAIMVDAAASVQRLECVPPAIDEAMAAMRHVIRNAKRVGAVISHARALVKRSEGEKGLVDISQVIRQLLRLVQPELDRHGVVVEAPLTERVPPVLGDRMQLQQVILNLIMNGIDAMTDVTTRPRRLVISCERGQGETGPDVLVAVQDTGGGAAAHDVERLFDPFFTTKRDALGLGLSIGRSIAQAHGGRLWARRNEDYGLTFYLLLPEASSSL